MQDKIKNHPALIYAQDIAELCKPLAQLHISYFAHVNVDSDGQFSALTNNPGFTEHYLQNKYFNVDIHTATDDLVKNYFIWDNVERRGNSLKMHQEAAGFGVKHTFTIVEKAPNGSNYYHFATDKLDKSINQIYLNHIDLLKLFIQHFNANVGPSKTLAQAYDLKFTIDENAAGYLLQDHDEIKHQHIRESFLDALQSARLQEISQAKQLTLRELEILVWMHYGKTAYDIGKLLSLSEVTINKHIANIKNKTQCYTQFQMGELFARLFLGSQEILDKVCKKYR